MKEHNYHNDVLITGAGNLAQEIVWALSLRSGLELNCAIASRDEQKAARICLLANARAQVSGSGVRFTPYVIRWDEPALRELMEKTRPRLVIQMASLQSPWHIKPNWKEVTGAYGFGITVTRQAILTAKLAHVIQGMSFPVHYVNGCYPDFVNQLIKTLALPITCGLGNISIVESIIKVAYDLNESDHLQIVGHHYHVSMLIREPERRETEPWVWINGQRATDLAERLRPFRLPPDSSVNRITGFTVVPLIEGLLGVRDVRLNLGAYDGLPGGLPVTISEGNISLDLPDVSLEECNAFNKSFEEKEGVTIDERHVRWNGGAVKAFQKLDPGFTGVFPIATLLEDHPNLEQLLTELG